MKSRSGIRVLVSLMLFSLLIVALSACGRAAPTGPQLSVLYLRDGSLAVLNGAAELGFFKLEGSDAALFDTHTWLAKGEVLIVSHLPAGTWFSVVNPTGFIAHVTADPVKPGAIMLVSYDPATRTYTMDCIQGICEMGPSDQALSRIALHQRGVLDQNGNLKAPSDSDNNYINNTYGDYIKEGQAIPTFTSAPAVLPTGTLPPAATANGAATATAACQSFISQFPGTPCP